MVSQGLSLFQDSQGLRCRLLLRINPLRLRGSDDFLDLIWTFKLLDLQTFLDLLLALRTFFQDLFFLQSAKIRLVYESLLLFILPKHLVVILTKITTESTNFDLICNVRTLFDLIDYLVREVVTMPWLAFHGVSNNSSATFQKPKMT